MAKAGPLRQHLLTPAERAEETTIVNVRVPKSWHKLLREDGIISDRLLDALNLRVKELKQLKAT